MTRKTKKYTPSRISERYQGLNPFSMVINTVVKKAMPAKTELLGKIIMNWPKLMDGLPSANATPSGISFKHGHNEATLTLSTTAAGSVEVEYSTPQTLDRLNRFLGKAIFTKITIKQNQSVIKTSDSHQKVSKESKKDVTIPPANANYKSLELGSAIDSGLENKLQRIYKHIQNRTLKAKETQ